MARFFMQLIASFQCTEAFCHKELSEPIFEEFQLSSEPVSTNEH